MCVQCAGVLIAGRLRLRRGNRVGDFLFQRYSDEASQ